MKRALKIVSLSLIFLLFGACSKEKDKNARMEDDGSTRFDSEIICFEGPKISSEGDYAEESDICLINGNYYSFCSFFRDTGFVSSLISYSPDGKIKEQRDLSSLPGISSKAETLFVNDIHFDNKVLISSVDYSTESQILRYLTLDVESGEVKEFPFLNDLTPDMDVLDIRSDGQDDLYALISLSDSGSMIYEIWCGKSDHVDKKVSLTSYITADVYEYADKICLEDGKVCVTVVGDETYILDYDCSSGEIGKEDVELPSGDSIRIFENTVYSFEPDGVYIIEKGEKKACFLFENTNIRRSLTLKATPIASDEDSITLSSVDYDRITDSTTRYVINVSKLDEKDYADKKPLVAAFFGHDDSFLDKAVYEFNKNHDDVYIKSDLSYIMDEGLIEDSVDWSAPNAIELYDRAYREKTAELVDSLRADLISGDCPDIIFNAGAVSVLCNDDCLADLSGVFEKGTDPEDLFQNVIAGAYEDGNISFFQL